MTTAAKKRCAQKLPDKLSKLILLGLDDLTKAERSKDYEVDMENWHTPNSICRICFAGSVMAFSLGADRETKAYPSDFGKEVKEKLFALDEARNGEFASAQCYLERARGIVRSKEGKVQEVTRNLSFTFYEDNKGQWKRCMRTAAKKLAAAGL